MIVSTSLAKVGHRQAPPYQKTPLLKLGRGFLLYASTPSYLCCRLGVASDQTTKTVFTPVDSAYVRPILDAIHLIEDAGRGARIVDCAHNDAWPQVEAALARMGRKPADVRWLILTHVHLDHAGGAGLFMSKLPNAKLVVHERGARHMIDPSKLYAGVEVVYGKETAKRLYGDLLPISEERVVIGRHGDKLMLGERTLEILDTPGHARHHISIVDHAAKGVFLGRYLRIVVSRAGCRRQSFLSFRRPRRLILSQMRCMHPSI